MGRRTLKVSEEAYNALLKMKKENESFTETILQLLKEVKKGTLLDYIKTLEPDEEFAAVLETVVVERETITTRILEP